MCKYDSAKLSEEIKKATKQAVGDFIHELYLTKTAIDLPHFLDGLDCEDIIKFSNALNDVYNDISTLLDVINCFADIDDYEWARGIQEMKHKLAEAVQICKRVEATTIIEFAEISGIKMEM